MTNEEIKKNICEAAQKIFDEKEFHEITLQDVAHAANVPLNKITQFYPTKEKLLNELLSNGITVITDFLQKTINERGKAESKINKIVRELLSKYEEFYPLFKLVSINMESLNENDLVLKGVLEPEKIEKYRQNTAIIGRLISKGQMEGSFVDCNPLEAAYMLRGLIVSAIRYWQVTGKSQPLENYADTVMRIFIKGIGK